MPSWSLNFPKNRKKKLKPTSRKTLLNISHCLHSEKTSVFRFRDYLKSQRVQSKFLKKYFTTVIKTKSIYWFWNSLEKNSRKTNLHKPTIPFSPSTWMTTTISWKPRSTKIWNNSQITLLTNWQLKTLNSSPDLVFCSKIVKISIPNYFFKFTGESNLSEKKKSVNYANKKESQLENFNFLFLGYSKTLVALPNVNFSCSQEMT